MMLKAVHSTEGMASIRPFDKTDRAFCIKAWVMALKVDNKWTPDAGRIVEALVDEAGDSLHIEVACLTQTPDVIVGYMVHKPGVLLFLYVRDKWRNHGIEEALFEEAS